MMPSLLRYFTIVGGLLFAGLIGAQCRCSSRAAPGRRWSRPRRESAAIQFDPRASKVERLRAEEAAEKAAAMFRLPSRRLRPPIRCRQPALAIAAPPAPAVAARAGDRCGPAGEPAQTMAPAALTNTPTGDEAERAVRAAQEKMRAEKARKAKAKLARERARSRRWRKPARQQEPDHYGQRPQAVTPMRRARPTGRSDRAVAAGKAADGAGAGKPPPHALTFSRRAPPPPTWRNAIAFEIERTRSRTASAVIAALHDPLRPGASGDDADVIAPYHHDADAGPARAGADRGPVARDPQLAIRLTEMRPSHQPHHRAGLPPPPCAAATRPRRATMPLHGAADMNGREPWKRGGMSSDACGGDAPARQFERRRSRRR